MSIRKFAATVALTLAGTLGASAAHAGNVHWSVGINLPPVGTVISNAPVYHVPPPVVYAPPPVVVHRPPQVVYAPPPAVVYQPAPRVVYAPYGYAEPHRHWHHRHSRHDHDRYDRQRRLVTLESIQTQTIQNKRNLETASDEFRQSMRDILADRERARDYLLRVSMIASLRRAAELG